MKQRLAPYAKALYRTCTVNSKRRSLYALPLSMLGFVLGTLFLAGIVAGASASLDGEALKNVLATVSASRFQLWMDFATAGTLSKVIFGLLYSVVALAWTAGIAGIHLGYAIPELGYAVGYLNVLWPVAGLTFISMQMIRFYELHTE